MLHRIKSWYQGEYETFHNEPGSPVVIFGGHYKRHWSARIIRLAVEFYLREWKWLFTAALTVAGLAIAYMKIG
jgi:hypothetical protein